MANGHGGQRTPANPAPASGPGRLSKRTDGGPGQTQKLMVGTDAPYGDREALLAQERSAGMSQQPNNTPMQLPSGGGGGGGGDAGGTPFGAPSQRPDEPVTHGVAIGPGAGPEALGYPTGQQMPTGYLTDLLSKMSTTDTTGTLATLYEIAKQRGV